VETTGSAKQLKTIFENKRKCLRKKKKQTQIERDTELKAFNRSSSFSGQRQGEK